MASPSSSPTSSRRASAPANSLQAQRPGFGRAAGLLPQGTPCPAAAAHRSDRLQPRHRRLRRFIRRRRHAGRPRVHLHQRGPGRASTVTIKAFNFQPDPITVKAGTTITFVNADQIHHTATAGTRAKPTPAVFNAEIDAAPDANSTTKATITLDKPGTYDYFCTFHPGRG